MTGVSAVTQERMTTSYLISLGTGLFDIKQYMEAPGNVGRDC